MHNDNGGIYWERVVSVTFHAQCYLSAWDAGMPIQGGLTFADRLHAVQLDYSWESLARIDQLLDDIRQAFAPEIVTFLDLQANVNFLYMLAFYVGEVRARSCGVVAHWASWDELIATDNSFNVFGKGFHSSVIQVQPGTFLPLVSICVRLFEGPEEKSVLFSAQGMMSGHSQIAAPRTQALPEVVPPSLIPNFGTSFSRLNGTEQEQYLDPGWPQWFDHDDLKRLKTDIYRLLADGRVVWGALVQANEGLFDGSASGAPFDVLYDPKGAVPYEDLRWWARWLFRMKGKEVDNPALQHYADHLQIETTRVFGWQTPVDVVSRPLLASTTIVHSDWLPGGRLASPKLPLLIHDSIPGSVMLVPGELWHTSWLDGYSELERNGISAKFDEHSEARLPQLAASDATLDERELLLLRRAAETHYAKDAYLPLARMLDAGRGALRDGAKAAHWAEKAREKDIEGAREFLRALPEGPLQRAIVMLARCETAEKMGKSDFPSADEITSLADDVFDLPDPETLPISFALHSYGAKLGSAESQFQLGHRYRKGFGTTQDVQMAMRAFRVAADMGNVYAQETLAEMYEAGKGVPKDEVTAMRWWQRASASGSYTARKRLGLKAKDGTAGSHFECAISLVPVGKAGAAPTKETLYGNVVGEFGMRSTPVVLALLALAIVGLALIAKAPWIGIALLLSAVVLRKVAVSWWLTVFTNAVEKKTLFKTTVVRLGQGTTIRYKSLRDPSPGIGDGTRAWVEVDDGKSSVRFGRAVDQWQALHEMLQIAEERDASGRALNAYSKGKPIELGPLRIEAGKLYSGRISVALKHVRHVTVQNCRLRVVAANDRVFSDIPIVAFPNAWTTLLVLESLLPFETVEFAAIPPREMFR